MRRDEEVVDACIAGGAFLLLCIIYTCATNWQCIASCCKRTVRTVGKRGLVLIVALCARSNCFLTCFLLLRVVKVPMLLLPQLGSDPRPEL